MSNKKDSLDNYIFYGMDDTGLTSNDMELFKYLYGDDPYIYGNATEWDFQTDNSSASALNSQSPDISANSTIKFSDNIDMKNISIENLPVICEGIDRINGFVDIDMLKKAMKIHDLTLPPKIMFVKPHPIYKFFGAQGWTGTLSFDRIYIDIELLESKNGIMMVQTIAHETWHLTKQPIILRNVLRKPNEAKAGIVGEDVMRDYMRLKFGYKQ